jgi:hypothetical protein
VAAKPARWYFDADLLGLAKLLGTVRRDVTWPGDSGTRATEKLRQAPSPVQRTDVPDEQWIPAVTTSGLVIVTRDRHIQTRQIEIDAVLASNARMFAISSRDQLGIWDQLEIVMCQWRAMDAQAQHAGPFIYAMTRTTLRRVVG